MVQKNKALKNLESIFPEITEEQTEAVNKIMEKQAEEHSAEIAKLQEQLNAANNQIKEFQSMKIDEIKASAAAWQEKYAASEKAWNEKLAALKYEAPVQMRPGRSLYSCLKSLKSLLVYHLQVVGFLARKSLKNARFAELELNFIFYICNRVFCCCPAAGLAAPVAKSGALEIVNGAFAIYILPPVDASYQLGRSAD